MTILSSLHAQQVFDRGYEMCANALFSLSVVLRFIGTEAQAQEVDTLVDALIDQTLEDLRQESLRILEVVESNGIQTAIGYTSTRTVDAQITSPQAIRHLAIIKASRARTRSPFQKQAAYECPLPMVLSPRTQFRPPSSGLAPRCG